ncbi:helix-turn-helix domain-containing protein [Trueperella bialowiezensis]|uniref:helix-turn-helix domain-containing protein n=1 Tax=Trueperella bialowiezensis TaxID=312285 RepID=UPI0013DE814D|nr:helix-turn-helix domain-containing protein [Trueperella bialowiezensis]
MAEKLYTTRQVSEMLNVSRQTVTRWCAEGYITYIELPTGQFRIPKSEVDRILVPVDPHDNSNDPLPGQGALL